MVIPSFSAFAPTPNTAQAFLGGVAASQRDVAERNDLAKANMAIQMQQQKLQQEAVQSNMEMQAKQQAHQDEMLLKDQQLKIQEQYQKNMIGLKQQQVEDQAKMVQMKTLEASRKYAAQQAFQTESQQEIAAGGDEQEVYRSKAMKYGPQMGITGPGMASLLKEGATLPPAMMENIPGDESGRFRAVQTGPQTRKIIDTQKSGSDLAERRFGFAQQQAGARAVRDEIKSLEKLDADDKMANYAANKQVSNERLNDRDKQALEVRKSRREHIAELRKSLSEKPAPAEAKAAPAGKYKEGQTLTHKKTGDKYRVTRGIPVLIQSGSDSEEMPDEGEDTEDEE